MNFILLNARVSKEEMATKLDMTIGEIKYYLKKLKDDSVVKREGANRNGKWVVNEELLVKE